MSLCVIIKQRGVMRPNTFEELPDELRPLYVRKQSMQTIGRWMTWIGALVVACAVLGTALLFMGVFSYVATLSHVVSASIVGVLLLLEGMIAIVVTNVM